jgi:hypothetical protein
MLHSFSMLCALDATYMRTCLEEYIRNVYNVHSAVRASTGWEACSERRPVGMGLRVAFKRPFGARHPVARGWRA